MDGMENEKKAEKEQADTKLPALASGQQETRSKSTKIIENTEIHEQEDLTLVDYIGNNYPRGKKGKKVFEKPAMSEEKIKDFMTKDPQASKFLSNMIPGGA